ncbi:histidine kinase sensor domain-containing protein [Metapseudomonas resinovorans]|uniref:histidine kinase n=1 Tax=Metapseudomonas resinovorans NBRC 106553 TaxID=1245471 RepID=S6AMS5_METRE|nr:histidine kinase sensor domain-containing protein [Pseudomonas resinovorans]BAN50200.1 putative two-component histidine kinase [Pseudomonas resinovorans NBRC 106553]
MRVPRRHSLFWKLTGALALFCLLLVSLYADFGRLIYSATSHLSDSAKSTLTGFAREAESAWNERGATGVDEFLQELRERERVWAVVVGRQDQSLSSEPLTSRELERLDFIRPLDGSLGRPNGWPTFYIPFSDGEHRLVLELPRELSPRKHLALLNLAMQRLLPALLAVLLGIVLYRALIVPLGILHRQAGTLSSGKLSARVGPLVTERRDEFGELGRAFDHMAERLEHTVDFQRQLLRDLSHELRTPLSRLRVAGEHATDVTELRQRLEREVQLMEQLIGDILELAWLDTERPQLPVEAVDVGRLWEVVRENAGFESGWPIERMPSALPADCRVGGHLNGLAHALENILRNAIRHSPLDGQVSLGGRREGDVWHLWVDDQGPGVAEDKLEAIFLPFTRLNAARPGGDGFGLGLSIARSMLQLQGGELWAENRERGLRMNIRLRMYSL